MQRSGHREWPSAFDRTWPESSGKGPWHGEASETLLALTEESRPALGIKHPNAVIGMEQPGVAPTLANLPGNVLQDIASCLDGHSLLALMRTCRDLHGSHALWACLFQAVDQQISALITALQAILQAMDVAEAMLKQYRSIKAAAPYLFIGSRLLLASPDLQLSQHIEHERRPTKLVALEQLYGAQAALQHTQAVWQPGQPSPELGPMVVQARQMAVQAMQVPHVMMTVVQHVQEMIQRMNQGVQQLIGMQVIEGIRARQLEELPVLQAAEQEEQQEREMMHAAVQRVVAGQPQAGDALQEMQRMRAQRLKSLARDTLQAAVQAAVQQGGIGDAIIQALQGAGVEIDVQALQAALQGAQAMLQDHAVP